MKNDQRILAVLAVATALLAGCAVGPDYRRPDVETPAAFKEGQGDWVKAAPADALERGPWWQLFDDPALNDLAARVEVDNQNVAMAVARYGQARAILAEQRASLFPTVNLGGSATRAGGTTSTRSGTSYQHRRELGTRCLGAPAPDRGRRPCGRAGQRGRPAGGQVVGPG